MESEAGSGAGRGSGSGVVVGANEEIESLVHQEEAPPPFIFFSKERFGRHNTKKGKRSTNSLVILVHGWIQSL